MAIEKEYKIHEYKNNFEHELDLIKKWAEETGAIKFSVDIQLLNGVNDIFSTIMNNAIQSCYFLAQEYFNKKNGSNI